MSTFAIHYNAITSPYIVVCCTDTWCKQVEELELELQRKEQEVADREAVNEFLRNEIRLADMKNKVK